LIQKALIFQFAMGYHNCLMWIIDVFEFIVSAGWRFWISMMFFIMIGFILMTYMPEPAKFWTVAVSIGFGTIAGATWTIMAKNKH